MQTELFETIHKPNTVSPKEIIDSEFAYKSVSKMPLIGTLVGENLMDATTTALARLRTATKDRVDKFVQRQLFYHELNHLRISLKGEQIDFVAQAILNIQNEKGLINGDMTGVGKGRQAASIIRYAILNKIPVIFCTDRAELFSDMYRDLIDINSSRIIKPFVTNKGKSSVITNKSMKPVFTMPDTQKDDIIKAGRLPKQFNCIFTTYSQYSSYRYAERREFLQNAVKGAIVVLDEAHKASGTSNTFRYYNNILQEAKSVVYFSATWAKRPENVTIYGNKTILGSLPDEIDVKNLLYRGGNPLAEVVAKNLVQEGQMFRREKSFKNVEVSYEFFNHLSEQHIDKIDECTYLIRKVLRFVDTYVKPMILSIKEANPQSKVHYTHPIGKVTGILSQIIFAIECEEIAKRAIEIVKNGEKPVITFRSTMEAFLKYIGIKPGELINEDITGVIRRLFEKAMYYKIDGEEVEIRPQEIGLHAWQAVHSALHEASIDITMSPIDTMLEIFKEAGVKAREITGRSLMIKKINDREYVAKNDMKEMNLAINDFNQGYADVLLLNSKGSVGISAHASEKFKDQRKRVMLIAQFHLDINVEVQIRGRVDRTNQVVNPAFIYLSSTIPAKRRSLLSLKNKWKKLDSNTSGNQRRNDVELDEIDIYNYYGNLAALDMLKNDPKLNRELSYVIKEDETPRIDDEPDLIKKFTGRLMVLSCEKQASVYEQLYRIYSDHVRHDEAQGIDRINIDFLDLDAKMTKRTILHEGENTNFFNSNVELHYCLVNKLRRPNTWEEVCDQIKQIPQQDPDELLKNLTAQVQSMKEAMMESIDLDYQSKENQYLFENDGQLTDEMQNSLKNWEAAKRLKVRNRIDDLERFIGHTISDFKIGDIYQSDNDNLIMAFLGYSINNELKEPYNLNNIRMEFCVMDETVRIGIPMAHHKKIQSLSISRLSVNSERSWRTHIDAFNDRGERLILTGNVFHAFQFVKSGKIIKYSVKDSEEDGIGILLPKKVDVNKLIPKKMRKANIRQTKQNSQLEFKEAFDLLFKAEERTAFDTITPDIRILKLNHVDFKFGIKLDSTYTHRITQDQNMKNFHISKYLASRGYVTFKVNLNHLFHLLKYMYRTYRIKIKRETSKF